MANPSPREVEKCCGCNKTKDPMAYFGSEFYRTFLCRDCLIEALCMIDSRGCRPECLCDSCFYLKKKSGNLPSDNLKKIDEILKESEDRGPFAPDDFLRTDMEAHLL